MPFVVAVPFGTWFIDEVVWLIQKGKTNNNQFEKYVKFFAFIDIYMIYFQSILPLRFYRCFSVITDIIF